MRGRGAPRVLAAALLLAVALPAAAWQEAALEKLQGLESALLRKEVRLAQVREDLAAVGAAEERAARRVVRRAAFDVGSAACKIVVADVDLHAGSVPAITQTVFSERVTVPLSDDLAQGAGAQFSESALQELRDVLFEFKKRAEEQGAEQFAGVATAAFRKASNGPAFLLQLREEGLPLRIISQDREALLGFLTANHLCPEVPAYDVVAWDCGGGSFQITTEVPPAFESWMKPVGTSVAKHLLLTKVSRPRHPRLLPRPSGWRLWPLSLTGLAVVSADSKQARLRIAQPSDPCGRASPGQGAQGPDWRASGVADCQGPGAGGALCGNWRRNVPLSTGVRARRWHMPVKSAPP